MSGRIIIIQTVLIFAYTIQCYAQDLGANNRNGPLFTLLDPSETSIKFTNQLHQSMVDMDNDGDKDIYVCKSLYDGKEDLRENELYINNGNLTFTESATDYNLNDSNRTTEANFFNINRDGDFDVFLVNQPKNSSFLAPLKDEKKIGPTKNYRLLENIDNRFFETPDNGGVSNFGHGLSSSIADFNNDGWQDIYVANDYLGPDFFYVNNGNGTFTDKIYENTKHTSYFSMGTDVGDMFFWDQGVFVPRKGNSDFTIDQCPWNKFQ